MHVISIFLVLEETFLCIVSWMINSVENYSTSFFFKLHSVFERSKTSWFVLFIAFLKLTIVFQEQTIILAWSWDVVRGVLKNRHTFFEIFPLHIEVETPRNFVSDTNLLILLPDECHWVSGHFFIYFLQKKDIFSVLVIQFIVYLLHLYL